MKTSLMIIPNVSSGAPFALLEIVQAYPLLHKRIGPSCCTLFTFITCYSLQIILSQNYLLALISVLVENSLLKTAYHFLLLLVGFDALTMLPREPFSLYKNLSSLSFYTKKIGPSCCTLFTFVTCCSLQFILS